MSFYEIHLLWHLLWVVPVICILYLAAIRKRRRILKLILGSRSDDPEFVLVSRYRRNVKFVILLLAVFFLALAAARPYWGLRIIPYSSRGRDLMVLFDVSKSMLAKDVQPSRMDHAKWFLRRLVSDCGGDRFGLIAFSGTSFLECPLTTDRTSFFQYLDELDTDTIPVGGTNIQNALETALKAFEAAESGHRAVILITDGDELEGNSSRVIEKLKEKKIPVIVVGIGDPMKPGLIPLRKADGTTGFMKDSKGELVKTRLNEKQLIALAQATGGCYARSTAADINLHKVLQRVQGLIPHNLESGKQTRKIERFYYPLIVGLLLLLAWFCISERKVKKVSNGLKTGLSAVVIASLIAFGAVSLSAQQPLEKSNKLLPGTQAATEPQQTQTPSKLNNKSKKTQPEDVDPVAVYDKALKFQKAKDKKAAELYRKAINLAAKNNTVRSNSYQNLGVIQHEAARQQVMQSMSQVKQQNLDGALKGLDAAKQALAGAEEHYVEAMALAESSIAPEATKEVDKKDIPLDNKLKKPVKTDLALNSVAPDGIAMNQQKLLLDRKMIDQLKKKIEELKKKQQQAQKKTQQAKQKQQQKNQQKNQKQNKQQNKQQNQNKQQQKNQQQNKQQQNKNKQDQNKQQQNKQQQSKNKQDQNKQQQKNQQKKQDQNKQQQKNQQKKQDQNKQNKDKQDQQKSPEQARKEAQKAVDDLKKAAKDLDQKKLEKSAEEAAKELKKAEDSQKKNQGKEAEKHLKKALEKLQKASGQQKQKKDDKKSGKNNNKDQNKQNKDSRDKNKNKGKGKQQDKKLPQQKKQAKGAKAKPAKEKDIDPKQAEAILRSMSNEEKNLRDAMKANLKRAYRNKKVEKDW